MLLSINPLYIFRFSPREQVAVMEWMSSSLPFHTMRDHPDHQVEIMGGMWGAKMDLGHRELFSNLTQLLINDVNTTSYRAISQIFLKITPGSLHWLVQGSGPGSFSKVGLATGKDFDFNIFFYFKI